MKWPIWIKGIPYSQYLNISKWPISSSVKQTVIPDDYDDSVMLISIGDYRKSWDNMMFILLDKIVYEYST